MVKNYYGVVEYQDRGTPHCHLLIWLHGALDPISLRQRLTEDATFQERVLQYVSSIVKEDLAYLLDNGEILTDDMLEEEYRRKKTNEERRRHPSIFPIPDPCAPNFIENFRKDVLAITKRTLYHRCNSTCKKYRRGRGRNCRFDFPRELVDPPGIVIAEHGIIAPQRVNAYINNHNPYVTAACRGNNDIKFISTRKHALAYIHYITDYITKCDASIHSTFLMCAATLERFWLKDGEDSSHDSVEKSKKFVTKCLNRISGQKELTGPQIAAYLLGITDRYTPENFSTVYLKTFENYLQREWRKLEKSNEESEDDSENENSDMDVDDNVDPEAFIIDREQKKNAE